MKAFLCFLFSAFCFLCSYTLSEAGVTMRLMAVNPAESEQVVPIKVYLPVEVKPEDVIYRGDLEVAYDAQQGSYYVFGEFMLQPKETLEKEVEIKDVWIIDSEQVAVLRQEAKEVLEGFRKTGYFERASLLYDGIERKLKEVEDMQNLSSASPGYKISNYRNCLSLLNSARSDLVTAKTLLSDVSPRGLAKFTWRIILFIVIFLGVLGAGSFYIWQRQARLESEQKPQE